MNQGHNQGMGGPNITSLVGGQTPGAGGMGPGSSPGMTPGMPNAQMVMYPDLCDYLASYERRFLAVSTAVFCCDFCCGVFRLGLSRRSFHVIGAIYLTRFSHTDNIDLIKLTPGKLNEGGFYLLHRYLKELFDLLLYVNFQGFVISLDAPNHMCCGIYRSAVNKN